MKYEAVSSNDPPKVPSVNSEAIKASCRSRDPWVPLILGSFMSLLARCGRTRIASTARRRSALRRGDFRLPALHDGL
jgi:hypothetical protein